jgi:DNA modification methylase
MANPDGNIDTIKNKILKYGTVAWRDVKPLQSADLKKYTPGQIKKLKASIIANGFTAPMYIWENLKGEMILLDGFHRIIAFKELESIDGVSIPEKIPALFIDCKDKKDAKKVLLILNSHYAEIQKEGLWDFIDGLDFEDLVAEIDIPGMDFDDISPDIPNEGIDAEAQMEISDELAVKWGVETGQVWELGCHRILCGDSGIDKNIERVMHGDKASCIFTDPPYGVSIADKNKMLDKFQKSGRNKKAIESDNMKPEDLKKILVPIFTKTREIAAAEDCTYFVTAPQGGELGVMMMMMMIESGLPVRHNLIWKKNCATFSMGRLDYDYAHEPIMLTWTKKHKRPMKGQFKTSVWEVAKPRSSKEHPTMKPVELYVNAYLNNSDPGDIVYEPFSGSGTAIIAAEQTGRKCRAIEIDPGYVAVALQRWADATGKEPRLVK